MNKNEITYTYDFFPCFTFYIFISIISCVSLFITINKYLIQGFSISLSLIIILGYIVLSLLFGNFLIKHKPWEEAKLKKIVFFDFTVELSTLTASILLILSKAKNPEQYILSFLALLILLTSFFSNSIFVMVNYPQICNKNKSLLIIVCVHTIMLVLFLYSEINYYIYSIFKYAYLYLIVALVLSIINLFILVIVTKAKRITKKHIAKLFVFDLIVRLFFTLLTFYFLGNFELIVFLLDIVWLTGSATAFLFKKSKTAKTG